MKIEIAHCNNIESGEVVILEKKLNIKCAINGTGKSTIARSIVASVNDRNNKTKTMVELTPFKYLGTEDIPKVKGTEDVNTIKVFDEQYINEFTFQPDELLKGSFDIFIRDDRYEDGMKEINRIVDLIREKLVGDTETTDLVRDFDEISASFGKTVKAGIHGSSALSKSLKAGNKVSNIPVGLELFSRYIQHESNYKWIKWQMDGKVFSDLSTDCPFCVTDIKEKKFDQHSFNSVRADSLKQGGWSAHENIREFHITINDPQGCIVGSIVAGIIEQQGRPVDKIDVKSKDVVIDEVTYSLDKKIFLSGSEIRLASSNISIDDDGGINSSNLNSVLARSASRLSLHGIDVAASLFPQPWDKRQNQAALEWPMPLLIVIDVGGAFDLDLNSARTQILASDKWYGLEAALARLVLSEISGKVSADYWLALKEVLKRSSKNEVFLTTLESV